VLSVLTCDKGRPRGDGGGDHARASSAFLTGCQARKTAGANFRAGGSADQVAASRLGDRTRLRSLELGIEPEEGSSSSPSRPITFTVYRSLCFPAAVCPVLSEGGKWDESRDPFAVRPQ
jgi:hypothetical protein